MNITSAISKQLFSAAKRVAARHHSSVMALVRAALEHQVALDVAATSPSAFGVLEEFIANTTGVARAP